jgi:hypothetical protein
MILYSQIQHLPSNHPLVQQFIQQEEKLNQFLQDVQLDYSQNEQDLNYFNRYVAGDR